jgi:hypothetical protein
MPRLTDLARDLPEPDRAQPKKRKAPGKWEPKIVVEVPVAADDVGPAVTSPNGVITEFIPLDGGIPLEPTDAIRRHVMRAVADELNRDSIPGKHKYEAGGLIPTRAGLATAIREFANAQEPLEADHALVRAAATAIALVARRKEERCRPVESSQPSSRPLV